MKNNRILPETDEREIQNKIIDLLKNMGYKFISQKEMDSFPKYRLNFNDTLLRDILKNQLEKINSFEYKGKKYKFSSQNLELAIKRIDLGLEGGLAYTNEEIYKTLMNGTSLSENINGDRKSYTLKYIDFDNIENNVFHFTEEFSVERKIKIEREKFDRPDLVLFINGIPFCVIELKSNLKHLNEGISQMIRNQRNIDIPHLFKFIQLVIVGNESNVKYATVNTPKKFWSVWREEEDFSNELKELIPNRIPTKLDKDIYSLLKLDRAIDIIRNYTLFDNGIKKIARYQQFFAIKKILNRVTQYDRDGARKGGLIWHTQGSGKSLTMVFLARILKLSIPNSKIILVTDRTELDIQIKNVFLASGMKGTEQAESGRDLIEKLRENKDIITTIINKFKTVSINDVIIKDSDIFVLVDEAHRTQGGMLHNFMKDVFPKACFLGFTGTPLLKSEKNSIKVFGKMIDKYTLEQGVKDKAILPLLYEGRMISQEVKDNGWLDKRFDLMTKNLTKEQIIELKNKWSRFEKVASSEHRLLAIALDIEAHFNNNFRCNGQKFKGMLATNSKYEAVKYQELFEENTSLKTVVVISDSDSRIGYESVNGENKDYVIRFLQKLKDEYGDLKKYEDKIKEDFIKTDDIDILIVVDKLLTGFDAPKATVLYIDKELKDHQLLQATARVNRLYEGKEYGYIVDYRGLLGNLDKALTEYASLAGYDLEDIVGSVIDIRVEMAKVKTYHSHLIEFFKSIKNKTDLEEYILFLPSQEKREKFYELLQQYSKALKLAFSSEYIFEVFTKDEIESYRKTLKFYNDLRKMVRIRYSEDIDFGEFEPQMQKLLDQYVSSSEVNQLSKIVNIFDLEFGKEVERIVGSRAKADTIKNAATKVIREKREDNPSFYDSLSEKIEKTIEEYEAKRLSDEEYLKNMQDIRERMMKGEDSYERKKEYPNSLKENPLATIFYDNIFTEFSSVLDNEEELAQFAIKVVEKLTEISKKPDWETNSDIHNEIAGFIEDTLWDLEDLYDVKFDTLNEIIENIISIGIRRFSKRGY